MSNLHETYTNTNYEAIRPDLDPRSRPLDMDSIAEIVQSPDPLLTIQEVSEPYPKDYEGFLAPVDSKKFKSCVDDRERIGRVKYDQNGNIMVFGNPYSFELRTDEYLTRREVLGSRPLAGGSFGVDAMCLVEGLLSNDIQRYPFWQQDGEEFVKGLIGYSVQRSNSVSNRLGMRVPIHIDNEHGTVPVLKNNGDKSEAHYENLEMLLNKMEGCGAHAKFLSIATSTVGIMGEKGIQEELMAKMDGTVTEKGVARFADYSPLAAELLYKNAIQQGSPVDIMIGAHKPDDVVFSLNNVSLNRRKATRALGQKNTFKVDLGVLDMPESTYAKVGQAVHQEFGNGFDEDRFKRFTVAFNLVTLMALGQEDIPRYYIDNHVDYEYNGAK